MKQIRTHDNKIYFTSLNTDKIVYATVCEILQFFYAVKWVAFM